LSAKGRTIEEGRKKLRGPESPPKTSAPHGANYFRSYRGGMRKPGGNRTAASRAKSSFGKRSRGRERHRRASTTARRKGKKENHSEYR